MPDQLADHGARDLWIRSLPQRLGPDRGKLVEVTEKYYSWKAAQNGRGILLKCPDPVVQNLLDSQKLLLVEGQNFLHKLCNTQSGWVWANPASQLRNHEVHR